MGFTVFKEIILRDYYLSRTGLEKFSNAFDLPECKHNLRLPCKGRASVLLFRAVAINCGCQDPKKKKITFFPKCNRGRANGWSGKDIVFQTVQTRVHT